MLENDPEAAFMANGSDGGAVLPADRPAEPAPEAKEAVAPAPGPDDASDADNAAGDPPEPEIEAKEGDAKDGEPEPKPDEGTKEPKEPWFQKRIRELTAQKHEEARRAQALEAQIAALSRPPEPEAEGEPARREPARPAISPEEYVAHVRAEAARVVAEQTFNATCNTIFDKGVSEYGEDFKGAINTLKMMTGDQGIPAQLIEAANETDIAPKVLHFLGKNPEEAARIMSLPPVRMAAQIAKLATGLNKPPAAAPVSKAPAPVPSIGGGHARVEKDPEKMSMAEFAEWDANRTRKVRA